MAEAFYLPGVKGLMFLSTVRVGYPCACIWVPGGYWLDGKGAVFVAVLRRHQHLAAAHDAQLCNKTRQLLTILQEDTAAYILLWMSFCFNS